jgi:hypothetical protein
MFKGAFLFIPAVGVLYFGCSTPSISLSYLFISQPPFSAAFNAHSSTFTVLCFAILLMLYLSLSLSLFPQVP